MILASAILAFAAALAPLLVARRGARALAWLAAAPLLAAGALVHAWHTGSRELVLGWAPSLGAPGAFQLDGLGLLFGLIALGVGAAVLVYSSAYFASSPRAGRIGATLLAFLASMLGVVLADDLVTLFIAWEATGACSFLLIGYHGERADARRAARRALVVTSAGALAMLVGFLVLAEAAGTNRISELGDAGLGSLPVVAALVLLGVLTKSAQAPFSAWLPGAMAAPAPISALLHSATLVKAGLFLVARLAPAFEATALWSTVLLTLGAVTTATGGLCALVQTDAKRLLAYTTVAGLGAPVLLLGLGTADAVGAALVLILAHALYKSALFLAAGAAEKAAGTRDLVRLTGVGRARPLTGAALLLGALSMAGLAPALGFVGKELGLVALMQGASLELALLTAVLLAPQVACAWLVGGRPLLAGTRPTAGRLPRALELPPLILATTGVLLGPPAALALGTLMGEAASAAGATVAPALNAWHVGPGLALSAVTLAVGALLLVARPRLMAVAALASRWRVVTPGALTDAVLDHLPAAGGRVSRVIVGLRTRDHLALALAAALVLSAGPLLLRGELQVPLDGAPELHEVLVACAVAAAVVAGLRTPSRSAAVATLGVAGAGLVLWFLSHGAPDLALTQFAVETLSILLFVFALRGLPSLAGRGDRDRGRWRARRDAGLALGIGLLTTALVWTVTARPHPSDLERALVESSVPAGHGRNVVNVILVDFRALDTLGELFVLALAAAGAVALMRAPARTSDPLPTELPR